MLTLLIASTAILTSVGTENPLDGIADYAGQIQTYGATMPQLVYDSRQESVLGSSPAMSLYYDSLVSVSQPIAGKNIAAGLSANITLNRRFPSIGYQFTGDSAVLIERTTSARIVHQHAGSVIDPSNPDTSGALQANFSLGDVTYSKTKTGLQTVLTATSTRSEIVPLPAMACSLEFKPRILQVNYGPSRVPMYWNAIESATLDKLEDTAKIKKFWGWSPVVTPSPSATGQDVEIYANLATYLADQNLSGWDANSLQVKVEYGDGQSETRTTGDFRFHKTYTLPLWVDEKTFYIKVTASDKDVTLTKTFAHRVLRAAIPPSNLRINGSNLQSIQFSDQAPNPGVAGQLYNHKFKMTGSGQVQLQWDPVQGANHYEVYRYDDLEDLDDRHSVGSSTSTLFTDLNVPADKPVLYVVTSVNQQGIESLESDSVRANIDLSTANKAVVVGFPQNLNIETPFTDKVVVASDGSIVGVPVHPGTFQMLAEVRTPTGIVASKLYSYVVNPAPPMSISTGSLPLAAMHRPYQFKLQATGGTSRKMWRVVSGILPEGLTLTDDGTIAGKPCGAAVSDGGFTIAVMDESGQVASRQFNNMVISLDQALDEINDIEDDTPFSFTMDLHAGHDTPASIGGGLTPVNGGSAEIEAVGGGQTPMQAQEFFYETVDATTVVKMEHLDTTLDSLLRRINPLRAKSRVGGHEINAGWLTISGKPNVGFAAGKRLILKAKVKLPSNRLVFVSSSQLSVKTRWQSICQTQGATFVDADAWLTTNREVYSQRALARMLQENQILELAGKSPHQWNNVKEGFIREEFYRDMATQAENHSSKVAELVFEDSALSRRGDGRTVAIAEESLMKCTSTLDEVVAEFPGLIEDAKVQETKAIEKAVVSTSPEAKVVKAFRLSDKARRILGISSRVLVGVAIVADTVTLIVAEDKWRAAAQIAGGWAGGWAGAEIMATYCAPLNAIPVWGQAAYITLVASGGLFGYIIGSDIATDLYDFKVNGVPPNVNFCDFLRRGWAG